SASPSVELGERLGEAASIWTAHLELAKSQTQVATTDLLQGFTSILDQLDDITQDERSGSDTGSNSSQLMNQRAALLAQCETRLRGLIENFHGFVQSREQVMASVRYRFVLVRGTRQVTPESE
ncbi:hypothetical protein ACVBEH_27580, partial [Roseateles sp. GG27B]